MGAHAEAAPTGTANDLSAQHRSGARRHHERPGRPAKRRPPVTAQDLGVRGETVLVGDPDLYLAKTTEEPLAEWAPASSYAVAGQQVTTPQGAAMLYARVPLAGTEQALQTLNGVLLPGVPALLLAGGGA